MFKKDWPVDSSWFKTKLKCVLSGSAKEVYETGSQSADLYLVSKVMLSLDQSCRMREKYKKALHEASYWMFPDLVLEMGLCCVDPGIVHLMLKDPDQDDQVR